MLVWESPQASVHSNYYSGYWFFSIIIMYYLILRKLPLILFTIFVRKELAVWYIQGPKSSKNVANRIMSCFFFQSHRQMYSIFIKRQADVIVYGAIRADHCMQAIQTDSSRSAAIQVSQAGRRICILQATSLAGVCRPKSNGVYEIVMLTLRVS